MNQILYKYCSRNLRTTMPKHNIYNGNFYFKVRNYLIHEKNWQPEGISLNYWSKHALVLYYWIKNTKVQTLEDQDKLTDLSYHHLFLSLARSPFSVRFRTARFIISFNPEPREVAIPYPLASRFFPTYYSYIDDGVSHSHIH